jgi:hypothetical protein
MRERAWRTRGGAANHGSQGAGNLAPPCLGLGVGSKWAALLPRVVAGGFGDGHFETVNRE